MVLLNRSTPRHGDRKRKRARSEAFRPNADSPDARAAHTAFGWTSTNDPPAVFAASEDLTTTLRELTANEVRAEVSEARLEDGTPAVGEYVVEFSFVLDGRQLYIAMLPLDVRSRQLTETEITEGSQNISR